MPTAQLINKLVGLPQCDAERVNRYCGTWEAKHPDKRCLLPAKFMVDGKNFCKVHAALYCLGKALEKGEDDDKRNRVRNADT